MKPALYVLCSGKDSYKNWQARVEFHYDLETNPIYPVKSAVETIHELAARQERPFLVCRDYIWIGLGMGRQVERLLSELDGKYSNWAVCGNRGLSWDDQLLDFSREVVTAALQTSLCAHPAISLDDNLLLINPQVLRRHQSPAPSIASLDSGVPLSLECLVNGSVMLVSPRLMTLRVDHEGGDGRAPLQEDPEFQKYYRGHFLNPELSTPGGRLNLNQVVDFSYLSNPLAEAPQADAIDLYDRALEAAKRKPSLTICCRTQFQRVEMLERAVLSFSVCREHASLLSDLRIQLVTDQPQAVADPVLRRLEHLYPAAKIQCWFHTVREKRLSRIDLLTAAVERAATDYIWFVDDDDYVNPAAFAALTRCLLPDCPLVVIASSTRVNEEWESVVDPAARTSKRMLMHAERSGRYSARSIFGVLRGDNTIHPSGMIFPAALLRDRLRNRDALGEYWEDYYLLLLALTASRVEVRILDVNLATLSSRGRENTTGETDRSIWHQSYATFLLEVLNNQEGNSPFLWQQANAPSWDWMES